MGESFQWWEDRGRGQGSPRGVEPAGLLAGSERQHPREPGARCPEALGEPRGAWTSGLDTMLPSMNQAPFLRSPRGGFRLVLCCASSDHPVYSFQVFRASSDFVVLWGLSEVKGLYYLVHFSLSRGSSPPRNQTPVSCIAGRFFAD